MKGIAFAPGHISAFFEPIYIAHNLNHSGSRGAGITLSLGATSQVEIQPASQQAITVHINGKSSPAPVTKKALRNLVGDMPIKISVTTILDLPVSQGFGMSAAGAFSATIAAADLLTLPRSLALKAAHHAEVFLHTGLGDVVASSFGGIEIRRKAGLPPWGMLVHIPGKYNVVLCVIGKRIETKKILTDAEKLNKISRYGRNCIKKLLKKPSLEHLISLGYEFTQKTGLVDPRVLQAIETVQPHGLASMCMLGNSVFAIGDTQKLVKDLEAFGKVFCCSVDSEGARVLKEK